jgi:hypothetical protein
MAISEYKFPVIPTPDSLPDNLDLVRRYCPTLAMQDQEQLAACLVHDAHGCWIWPGPYNRATQYGSISTKVFWNQSAYASHPTHRFMYDTMVGPISEGLHIHHRCEVKACWHPLHLEAVTPKEHAARHHPRSALPPWHAPVQLTFAFGYFVYE